MSEQSHSRRSKKSTAFRIGRVRVYLRGRVWYLCYYECGRRYQPRVGPDRDAARQMAAEINAQLEIGVPSALCFQPISFAELRQRWLDYHEHVRHSSVATVCRYRRTTDYLLRFLADVRPLQRVSDFRASHAEDFVRYLRTVQVPLGGPAERPRRKLRDAGLKHILAVCSILFNYSQRNRHLPPYAENPFRTIGIGRIPIEDARPIYVFTAEQERKFLEACDDWQFPVYLTLLMTGLRSAELTHLLLPDDVDLDEGWLHVRNKPKLGWQVKTRNERAIPLVPVLAGVLRVTIHGRSSGPVFRQRNHSGGPGSPLASLSQSRLQLEVVRRCRDREVDAGRALSRLEQERIAWTVWRNMGAIYRDSIYHEFGRITKSVGLVHVTAPKTLRHTFATILQDANVETLIRNELMGHMSAKLRSPGGGLGMTAVYTHTRPETKRAQLEMAFANHPAVQVAEAWVSKRRRGVADCGLSEVQR